MGLRVKGDALPTIEEIAAGIKNKKAEGEKPAGQPKEPGDTSTTVVDPESESALVEHLESNTETPAGETEVEKEPEVPATPVEKPKDPQAAKFAALARREKAFREQQAEVERRRAEIDARAAAIEEREASIKGAKRPSDILKAHGLTYQQVTEDMLGVYKEPEKDPVDVKLQERLDPYEKRFEEMQAKIKEMEEYAAKLESDRIQTVQRQIDDQISSTAKEKNCDYMLAAGDEAIVLTRNLIQEYWNKNKKILSYDEACDRIEAYYTERLDKFYETPKARSKYASAPVTPTTQKSPATPAKAERPSTLTNSLSQGTRASTNIDGLPKNEALELLARKLKYTS